MQVTSTPSDQARIFIPQVLSLLLLLHFSAWGLSNSRSGSVGRSVFTSTHTTQAKGGQKPSRKAAPAPSKSDRQGLTLTEALMGHWVNEKHNSHYFYSKDKFISVSPGSVGYIYHKIKGVNEKERQLRIRITKTHFIICTLSPDNNQISYISEIADFRSQEPMIYKFVDDTREPSRALLRSIAGENYHISTISEPSLIIGDNKTQIFYWDDCPEYETLPLAQRVYFKTKGDAQRAGFRAAKTCP